MMRSASKGPLHRVSRSANAFAQSDQGLRCSVYSVLSIDSVKLDACNVYVLCVNSKSPEQHCVNALVHPGLHCPLVAKGPFSCGTKSPT